jgi:hypothetical protein
LHLGPNTGVHFGELIWGGMDSFADGTRHTVCKVANAAGAGKIIRLRRTAAARQDFTDAN